MTYINLSWKLLEDNLIKFEWSLLSKRELGVFVSFLHQLAYLENKANLEDKTGISHHFSRQRVIIHKLRAELWVLMVVLCIVFPDTGYSVQIA
jgi:hypothetical protein